MKKIVLLAMLVTIAYACSSDDNTGSSGGTAGVNFDLIAMQPRLSPNMYQFNRVNNGEAIGPAKNFIQESGRLGLDDFVLLGDQLVFYNDLGDFNDIVFYDINSESVRVIPPGYFQQTPDEDYVNRRKGVTKDFVITTFFKISERDLVLGAPFYAMKYDLDTETITEFPIIDLALEVTRTATSGKFFFAFYSNTVMDGLVVINTETDEIVQDLVLSEVPPGIQRNVGIDGDKLVVQDAADNSYQIIDLNTGSIAGSGSSSVTFASTTTFLFDVSITDTRLYIELAAAQPSPISSLPAFIDRDTGELTLLDTFAVQDAILEQFPPPPFLVSINGFAIDPASGIVIYGVSMQESDTGDQRDGGLIYTNFDAEIIEYLPISGGSTGIVLLLD